MHARPPIDPPAIVAQADLTEEQIVQELVKADIDHFAVGRYILQLKRSAGGNITDQDIADRINALHPDKDKTNGWVRHHRIVAELFRKPLRNLPWSHHLMAAQYGPDRAAEWLNMAADCNWSAESLRLTILADRGESGGVGRLTFFRRQIRELFPNRTVFPNYRAVRRFLKDNEDLVLDNRKEFAQEAKQLVRDGQEILDFLESRSPEQLPAKGKES